MSHERKKSTPDKFQRLMISDSFIIWIKPEDVKAYSQSWDVDNKAHWDLHMKDGQSYRTQDVLFPMRIRILLKKNGLC